MSKKPNILFVVEGEKMEKQVFKYFVKKFFPTNICISYRHNIYDLYEKVNRDEYLDLFPILKEKDERLKKYKRTDFAQICLFFDYDGHDTKAEDEKIKKLIEKFDGSKESEGTIFISYPMVEALRHIPNNEEDFKTLIAESSKDYKKTVGDCKSRFEDIRQIDFQNWIKLIELHLKKLNFIVNDAFKIPEKIIPQIDVFSKQMEKHLRKEEKRVAVLSGFPAFLFDYYGNFEKIIKKLKISSP